jgi:hypothetical protein
MKNGGVFYDKFVLFQPAFLSSHTISGCTRRIVLETVRIKVGQGLFQQGVNIVKPRLRLNEENH